MCHSACFINLNKVYCESRPIIPYHSTINQDPHETPHIVALVTDVVPYKNFFPEGQQSFGESSQNSFKNMVKIIRKEERLYKQLEYGGMTVMFVKKTTH